MSSLGGHWRVLRHYLSLSNLHSEVEKLAQRVKPASPEQWDNLIKKFEKIISLRMTSSKQLAIEKLQDNSQVKITMVEDVNKESKVEKKEVEDIKPGSKIEKKEDQEVKQRDSDRLGVGTMSMEGLWQGLKLKTDIQLGKVAEPSWKHHKTESKTSIHARTAYVISAVVHARDTDSALRRTERLITHLHDYPEARDYAIKEGVVRALLRLKRHAQREDVTGAVREALALVGHVGPPRWAGANILSLDGGGIRGIVAIEVLRHLERLTGRRVTELFDLVVGVSTGAILAAVLSGSNGSLEHARSLYRSLSRDMFGGTSRLGGASRLVLTHAYYDTARWERMLHEQLRDCTLSGTNRHNVPQLAVVSCVVNSGARLSPFLFRSYAARYRRRSAFPGTSRALLWHAVRASAAAPTYFDEFRLRGALHQDGGIVCNNPAAVALHEARLLFGGAPVLLSLGTGRAPAPPAARAASSWKDKFNNILDSATDTEGVHLVLSDLLPAGRYFRFNPPLMRECAMDEIDDDKLDCVLVDTKAYIRRNQHKFEQCAAALTRPRSLVQRAADFLRERAVLAGVAPH